MTAFEIITIVLSSLAFLISLPAFIISMVKIKNEKRQYKKQFIINNLIKLRDNLNEELTRLENLNPVISMALIFKRIEDGENFDYYNEILNLQNTTSVIVSNAIIMLSSYKATECSVKTMGILQNISSYAFDCLNIVIDHKDKKSICTNYITSKGGSTVDGYANYKTGILIELSNTINHFIKDNISEKEIDKFFVQTKLKDEDKIAFYAVKSF